MGLQEPKGLCPHARIYSIALLRFKHQTTKSKHNSLYPHAKPQNGAKMQHATNKFTSPPLTGKEAKYVQEVAGTLLYYARAVNSTILPALSAITMEQANPTEKTRATIKQLLDYCAMQDKAVLAYKASKMILAVHSDAGYCNKKKSRSRAGGHFFLYNDDKFLPTNLAILTVATIIKAIMSSAAEAELGALYLTQKRWHICHKYLPRWATHNHKPQSKPTT